MAIDKTTDLSLVGSSQIVDDSVTSAKIAAGAVGTAKIDSGTATSGQFLGASGSGGASFASVEGTAIKSTSATVGYVLTAGAGGTTTTWAAVPAAGGNYNAPSTASAVFTQPASVTSGTATFGSRDLKPFNAGASGSVVGVKDTQNNVPLNPTYNVRFYPYNSVTAFSTVTFTPAQSGSTIADGIFGYGFDAASTCAVWKENSGSGTVVYTHFRKMNPTGGTILWSTTLLSAGSSTEGIGSDGFGPMIKSNYAKEVGAWIGGDYRYSDTYWTGTASMWLINDTSGTAYSAAFATASGTSLAASYAYTETVLFVPAESGSAGTVHAWISDTTAPRGSGQPYVYYAQYSASPTAITQVMAPNQTATFAGLSGTVVPKSLFWDQTTATGVANYGGTLITFSRTGSLIAEQGKAGTLAAETNWMVPKANSPRQVFDPRTGWVLRAAYFGTAVISKMGTALQQTSAPLTFGSALGVANEGAVLAGIGSATHVWYNNSPVGTGNVAFQPLPGYAEVSVLGTASASVEARILATIATTGGTSVYVVSPNNVTFGSTANAMVIVPGTATYKVGLIATTLSTAAATALVTSYNIELA